MPVELVPPIAEPLALVIPTRNEAATISTRVRQACLRGSVVVVIDDGSTDGTPRLAASAGAIVIPVRPDQGVGPALREGIRLASTLSARVVVARD